MKNCSHTLYFSLIIVKSLQLRGHRQIAEPRKYCLVRLIAFFDMCFLYFFCFSQVGISVKFPTGSTNEVNKKMWSGLWRLKVPNKVKTFAWQACTESLPTLVKLARRKVVLSNSCTSCNRELESVIQAL